MKLTNKKRKLKPWMTAGILTSIKRRDVLYKKYSAHRRQCAKHNLPENPELRRRFVSYRNWVNRLVKTQRESYYEHELKNSPSPKKSWAIINELTQRKIKNNHKISELIVNNRKITDKTEIANVLNEYFINVASNLATNKRLKLPNLEKVDQTINSFAEISEREVLLYINSLKSQSSTGPDGISAKTLKICKEHIVHPLCYIFNLCLQNGSIPDRLKVAYVTPVFKAGSKTDTNNYRPISNISQLAKLLEKCIKSRLNSYLDRINFFSKNQFGFQANKSTEDAVFHLTKNIIENFESHLKSIAIFLDLRKAFDTVNHAILIQKLENIGLIGPCIRLFKNYLTNRIQLTKNDDVKSHPMHILLGVPQGTVLGPILLIFS